VRLGQPPPELGPSLQHRGRNDGPLPRHPPFHRDEGLRARELEKRVPIVLAQAQKTFLEDLVDNRLSGRSLAGLKTSIEKQGRPVPPLLEQQLADAWRNATVSPPIAQASLIPWCYDPRSQSRMRACSSRG
jgi:hypothetical protein